MLLAEKKSPDDVDIEHSALRGRNMEEGSGKCRPLAAMISVAGSARQE